MSIKTFPQTTLGAAAAAVVENIEISFFVRYSDRIQPEPNSGCWLWTGAVASAGYGHGNQGNRHFYAHREAFECANGKGSAKGLVVRHKCDNPYCVNPDHLLAGTQADNCADAKERGRLRPVRGQKHPRAVLRDDQAAELRSLAETNPVAELARIFGVTYAIAHNIASGANWTHVGAAPAVRPRAKPHHPGFGEDAPRAKLTNEQVAYIRTALRDGKISGRDLAKMFGVSPATISSIKVGRNWSAK